MSFRNRSADVSRFSIIPSVQYPRSVYHAEQTHKTTFDAGKLVPIYIDEILPGDSVRLNMTAFARLATPIYPLMDNLYLDTFFFFVPMRLVWPNSHKFFGEREDVNDSDAYTIPILLSPAGGFEVGSLADYFGLPTVGQVTAGQQVEVNALPFRAYVRIWNDWFRDQNLQDSATVYTNVDGPDTADYSTVFRTGIGYLFERGKRHDYFTSCLPWPEKPQSLDVTQGFAFNGGAPVSGLGGGIGSGVANVAVYETGGLNAVTYTAAKQAWDNVNAANEVYLKVDTDGRPDVRVTINNLRTAFAVQLLLERNARGGTRYIEFVLSQFGVRSPDFRLQRSEYLGGGSTPISVSAIAQTSATNLTGGSTPLGKLGGVGTAVAQRHGFGQSFTEHGYIIGLANVRADLNYQQGLHRMWSRRTRWDFYVPALAHLGEQAVLRQEIYCNGVDSEDATVFGYQERWAEYRHKPNRITGLFRSTSASNIDEWHLGQNFGSAPVLDYDFIIDNPPVDRVIAVNTEPHILFDGLFSVDHARVMPTWSVPGLGARF